LQPTQVVLLRDIDLKKSLAQTAMLGPGNIYRAADSSAVAIFLSDLEPHKRLKRIIELEKEADVRTKQYIANLPIASTFLLGEGHIATFFKQFATHVMSPLQPMPSIDTVQSWSYKNTSLLAQTFVLSATSHGLATCLMEGFDDRRVKELLRIPDRYGIPLMCCLGYEYEDDTIKNKAPRLKPQEVFFGDTFGRTLDFWDRNLDKPDANPDNKVA